MRAHSLAILGADGGNAADEIAEAANQAGTHIEAYDENDDDNANAADDDDNGSDYAESGFESGGEDGGGSVTTSVSSSVRDYTFENGRRYHKFCEGRYVFPNDEAEQDREDMKHAMTVAVCGDKLFFAPLGEHPSRILDLGTGTGIWCIDMGDAFPSAEVIGVDLSPIQPTWVPPNVRFLVDDIESEWLYSAPFDMIHIRAMAPAIKDWPRVLSSAYAHLKPGAYLELQEIDLATPACDDGTMGPDWPYAVYMDLVAQGLRTFAVDMRVPRKLPHLLHAAGFRDVTVREIKVPLGPWAKNKLLRTCGLYMQAAVIDAMQMAVNGPLCKGLGWKKEEADVLVAKARASVNDPKVHAYYTLYMIWAQKPE